MKSPGAMTNMRWVICALLFWVTTANYIDRGVFGNLAPELQKTIGWTDEQYWNMQVAFSAAYAVSMLVMGRLMDLLGLRRGYVLACAAWGVASMLHAFAPEIGGLFGGAVTGFFLCRILLGLGEGGNFPAAIKATAEWFPKKERALATGLFNSGTNIGGVLVPWALPFILVNAACLVPASLSFLAPQYSQITLDGHAVNWRGAFVVTAIVDLGWIIAWWLVYREPEKHPRVNSLELAHIQEGTSEPAAKIPWRELLPHRQTWAFAGAKLMTDAFWWFYLFGSPDFFSRKFALDAGHRKYLLMLIYLVASVGSIGGGWLAGWLMKRGATVNFARKLTLLACALCVLPVFYSALTDNPWIAAALITLAAFGHQAWSSNVYCLAGDMFPKRFVGSLTGFGGMVGCIGSMTLFFATGKILKVTGNYLPVFIIASAAYLSALALIQLVVPKLEPAKIS